MLAVYLTLWFVTPILWREVLMWTITSAWAVKSLCPLFFWSQLRKPVLSEVLSICLTNRCYGGFVFCFFNTTNWAVTKFALELFLPSTCLSLALGKYTRDHMNITHCLKQAEGQVSLQSSCPDDAIPGVSTNTSHSGLTFSRRTNLKTFRCDMMLLNMKYTVTYVLIILVGRRVHLFITHPTYDFNVPCFYYLFNQEWQTLCMNIY